MIFVKRKLYAPPDVLVAPGLAGDIERARVASFFQLEKNKNKAFKTFRTYKHASVISVLERLFHLKCAYCESMYAKVHPVDVEHFRPKGGVAIEIDGKWKLFTPGYYWLASEWTNLFPSCIDCNRQRTHKFQGLGRMLSGKANLFPLADERKRAIKAGDERFERPLLLNPCSDKPDKHLIFQDDGNVQSRKTSKKGECSVRVYGLRRPVLVQSRNDVAVNIVAQIKRLRRLEERKCRFPSDRTIEVEIKEEMVVLKSYVEPKAEYAGMARQIIARNYRKV